MKIAFISNYFNHHQKPFSDEMWKLTDGNYTFIQTRPMEEERIKLGWQQFAEPYIKCTYKSGEEKTKCEEFILDADVVIYGSAPYKLIVPRIKSGKLTFIYAERLHKEGYNYLKLFKHIPQFFYRYGQYKNLYCLCSSAFTSFDFAKTFTFIGKTFKWGYFPTTKIYENIDDIIGLKHPASILWTARFIGLKHPEVPIEVAKRLKADGYDFILTMIGNGVLFDDYKKIVKEQGLFDFVKMTGSMTPVEVRTYMEQTHIFLFTSDRNEGWGAVLNESMNSGCAVVGSSKIGSVPFMIQDGKNGLIYKDGDIEDVYKKVRFLLDNPIIADEYGRMAYQTITKEWCAENAAQNIIKLAVSIHAGSNMSPILSGPCSKADILPDWWYK